MKTLWQDILALRTTSTYFSEAWSCLRKLLLVSLGWIILCEILMVIQYWPLQGITNIIVNTVAKNQPIPWIDLVWFSVFLFVSLGIGIYCHTRMDNWRNDFVQGEFSIMQSAAMDKLLNLPTSWHVEHSTGEKDSKVKENVDRLEYVVSSMAYGAIPTYFRILITSVALIWVGWPLLLFGVIAMLGYLALTKINLKVMKALAHDWHKQREEISDHSKGLIANWYALRSFGRENDYIESHHQIYKKYWDDDRIRHKPWRNRLSTHELFVASMTVLFYWVLVLSTLAFWGPQVTVGALVMAMFWVTRLLNNLYQLNDFLRYYHRGKESLHEMVMFFQTKSDMPQPENPLWPEAFEGGVVFNNVSFKYPGKEDYALRNINLEIQPGEVVALVGESGGGKSTFASLIAGERPATEGAIEVDGVNICELDLRKYRREGIAVVPQRSSLLTANIAENVRLGKADATEEQIENALREAFVWDYVSKLPDGMNSKVGEHGVYLSGGQQQRVAIARAFIRDTSRILVLDEATSSLDGSSQREVQASLERLISHHDNKTVVVIAHRLSTVQIAQRIIVVKDGQIIGQGPHEKLMSSCDYYRQLCDLELNGGNGKNHVAAIAA